MNDKDIEGILHRHRLENYFDYCKFGEERYELTGDFLTDSKVCIDFIFDKFDLVLKTDYPKKNEGEIIYVFDTNEKFLNNFIHEYAKKKLNEIELKKLINETIDINKDLITLSFIMYTLK